MFELTGLGFSGAISLSLQRCGDDGSAQLDPSQSDFFDLQS